MQPFSPHSHFFSSLKQVEKRLKLETSSSTVSPLPPPPPPPAPAEKCTITQIDSMSTPIYLQCDQPITGTTNSSALGESDPPQEFLSNSPDFLPTQKDSLQGKNNQNPQILDVERSDLDEIELLMELLGLSDVEGQGEAKRAGFDLGCDDEFYGKIVGVKGPKSLKEVERLEGWISHFSKGGEVKEPLRLAHLLLGKTAFLYSLEGSDGFGGIEFPSTIDEFLLNDPPLD